jgi:hypothetical protein
VSRQAAAAKHNDRHLITQPATHPPHTHTRPRRRKGDLIRLDFIPGVAKINTR